MPKSINEFKKLQETDGRQGGRKVDWSEIAKVLNTMEDAYSVKEIWEHPKLVNKRVTQFRTMNALNKLFEEHKIDRKYDGKRYWFCKLEGKTHGRHRRAS